MIFTLLMGYLNAMRGSGIFERDWWIMIMAWNICWLIRYQVGFSLPHIMMLMPLVYGILMLGFMPGWGKYFNVAFTNIAYINEREFKPIDWVCDIILGKPTTILAFERWCFLAMTLRGMLFYPLFVFLSLFNPMAMFYGWGVCSMGIVYWLRIFTPESYSIRIAEFAYGCVLGALIYISLTVY